MHPKSAENMHKNEHSDACKNADITFEVENIEPTQNEIG